MGDPDLPVFGTAESGKGALIMTDEAVSSVTRPAPLLRIRDGYGIIVAGDSMIPEHKPGSIALVNPHLPPQIGDTCLFRSAQTNDVTIKELRGSTETEWRVRQHNPKRDFRLKKNEWPICHKTIGSFFP